MHDLVFDPGHDLNLARAAACSQTEGRGGLVPTERFFPKTDRRMLIALTPPRFNDNLGMLLR